MSDRKKFVIKPFRPNITMDKAKAQNVWEALEKAIKEIQNKNSSSLSFEELYRNAYSLVLHKHGDLLYTGVDATVQRHLLENVVDVVQATDDQLLRILNEKWTDHKITMMMIRDILMYMDRTYVSQQRKIPVYDMGLNLFYSTVVRHEGVQERLRRIILDTITKERNGELVDRSLLRDILSMYVDLGINSSRIYEEEFENEFLENTVQYYRAEAQAYLDQNTCPDYLRKVERRLIEEHERVSHYLSASSEPKLKQRVEQELIQVHSKSLVDMEGSGCMIMFQNDKVEDLSRMFSLFCRIPRVLGDVHRSLLYFVRDSGNALIRSQQEVKDAMKFVQGLLDLREKVNNIVVKSFNSDTSFQKSMKDGFEAFVNTDTTCASYLAQYVDDMLKSGLKGFCEADVDTRLDSVVTLFRYIQDKDIFEEYYKRYLSKRLLSGRSFSDEVEKSMLTKLKAECGYQFTSKLEGMFKDMKTSKDTMDSFRREVGTNAGTSVELHANVLTAGFWPIQEAPQCTLPPEVIPCGKSFKSFYLSKHSGRRLTWQVNMGTADLRVIYPHGRNELNVSTYQMCILMLYNRADSLSFTEIKEQTDIPETDLRRHLISLCTPKYRVLRKSSKGKSINQDDTFAFNQEYKSKLHRVRIPLVSQKETTLPVVPQHVAEDRTHLIEASIVRIMKTRKTMQHNNVVTEVTRQLSSRFVPAPQLIKRRIESLIEREYLERSQADRRVYNYVA